MTRSVLAMLLLAIAGCPDDEDFGHLGRAWPASDQDITPQTFDGNFVAADDDQVCYELDRLVGWGVTEEMRGFKVDPPASTTRPMGIIAVEQPTLGWVTSADVHMVGVIVKGADAFNLYTYRDTDLLGDDHLHSPYKHDKIPAISHYNICYMPAAPSTSGEQGCTPGYWRNHLDRWAGVSPTDDFDATFNVDAFSPNVSLATAISLRGGGTNALARHATAALLNAYGGVPNPDDRGTVAYPLRPPQVIKLVKSAVASGDVEVAAAILDGYNNLGCPLHGTTTT